MPNLSERSSAVITVPKDGYDAVLVGWEEIAKRVECRPGVVAVVPDQFPKRYGSILLPDEVQGHVNADIGTVVSSGVQGYEPGDKVLYLPWAGNWFTPFRVGKVQVHEMRLYGLISPSVEDLAIKEDVSNHVPAIYKAGEIKPIGEWVLIRRDPLVKESGEFKLLLTDDAKYRTWKATVVAAGPKATAQAGDRVMYHGPSLVVGLRNMAVFGNDEDAVDLALIRDSNLYCTIHDDN